MSFNKFEVKAVIVAKRWDNDNDVWVTYTENVRLRPIPALSYFDSVDGELDQGNFSFTSKGKILFNNNELEKTDFIKFEWLGNTITHMITNVTSSWYSSRNKGGEKVLSYTIQTQELTRILSTLYANLSFPRAVEGQVAPREVANLGEVVGRCAATAYIQKTGGGLYTNGETLLEDVTAKKNEPDFLSIWDTVDENLFKRLQSFVDVPQMTFRYESLYSIFKYVFSLIGSMPYMYMNDQNRIVLGERMFQHTQDVSQIDSRYTVADGEDSNMSGYGSNVLSVVNNVSGIGTTFTTKIRFSSLSEIKWSEDDATLDLPMGISKVISFKLMDSSVDGAVFRDFTDYCVPKEVADSRPRRPDSTSGIDKSNAYNYSDYLCYYEIGGNTISGFGDKQNDPGDYKREDRTWYLMTELDKEQGSSNEFLVDYVAEITYETLISEDKITIHRDDISICNKFSQIPISIDAQVMDYNASHTNLKAQINRSGIKSRYIKQVYTNPDKLYIAPLLSTYDNWIIVKREFSIGPRKLEVVYTLSSDFSHINEHVGVNIAARGTAYDNDNALVRHIIYDEFVSWDTELHTLNNVPSSLTRDGVLNLLPRDDNNNPKSIDDCVFVAPKVIQTDINNDDGAILDTGLMLGVQTSFGEGSNSFRVNMKNNIYASWEVKKNDDDDVVQTGVPYTENGGYLNSFGLSVGSNLIDPEARTPTEISRLPYITWRFIDEVTGLPNDEYDRFLDNILISMGNINPAPTEDVGIIDKWTPFKQKYVDNAVNTYTEILRQGTVSSEHEIIPPLDQVTWDNTFSEERVRLEVTGVRLSQNNRNIEITDIDMLPANVSVDILDIITDYGYNKYPSREGVNNTIYEDPNVLLSRYTDYPNLLPKSSITVSRDTHNLYAATSLGATYQIGTLSLGGDSFFPVDDIDSLPFGDFSYYYMDVIVRSEFVTNLQYKATNGTSFTRLSDNITAGYRPNLPPLDYNITINGESNKPVFGSGFGSSQDFDLAKASNETLSFGMNLNHVSLKLNDIIIGNGMTKYSPLFMKHTPIRYELYGFKDITFNNFSKQYIDITGGKLLNYSTDFNISYIERNIGTPSNPANVLYPYISIIPSDGEIYDSYAWIAVEQFTYYDIFDREEKLRPESRLPIILVNNTNKDKNIILYCSHSSERIGISMSMNPYLLK